MQILVDQNTEALSHPYICINLLKVSADNRMLAFTMDTTGDDSFSVHIKDLTTGARLKVQFNDLYKLINQSINCVVSFNGQAHQSQSPDSIYHSE